MSKLPISVCIIAKNEERYLEGCLQKLKPFGFEIIVADTGSTDRTKEIAQKYADKVVDFEWIDDFSAARNYCASFAKNNWIIALDCDEYLNKVDVPQLLMILHNYPKVAGVIRLKNLVTKPDGSQSFGTDDVTRIYNKKFYHFTCPIHEQITPYGGLKEDETLKCFLSPIEVIHHGYNVSAEEMKAKQVRNLSLLYKSYEKDPNDPYVCFQIGQSEYINENYEKAISFYEKGVEGDTHTERTYVQVMVESLARAYMKVGRNEDAIALMDRFDGKMKAAKFYFTYASILYEQSQHLKALLMYIKTTLMADVDTLGDNKRVCYEKIIDLYNAMGNFEMAENFRKQLEACREERDRVFTS